MKRRKHCLFINALIGCWWFFASAFACGAGLRVELLLDPKNPVIDLAAPQEVAIVARTIGNDAVTYRWKLEGVGKLGGGEGDAGRLYIPPQAIKGDVMQTTISVTVTDSDGKNATASAIITLKKPPAATPTPPPPLPEFDFEQVRLVDSAGAEMTPTYFLDAGETILLDIMIPEVFQTQATLSCTAARGKITAQRDGKFAYTLPRTVERDFITIKAVNASKQVIQRIIKVQVKPQ